VKLNRIRQDLDRAGKGVWCPYVEDVELLIGGSSQQEYANYIRRATKPYQNLIRRDQMPDDKAQEIMVRGAARYLLLGWKNLQDDNGEDIPYSEDKAHELLSDPRLRDLYRFVTDMSNENSLFAEDQEEDDRKN